MTSPNDPSDELAWRRTEQRLAAQHAAADPPLSPELWRGIAARIAAPPRPHSRRPTGRLVLGALVLIAAAGVALWVLPSPPQPTAAVARVDEPAAPAIAPSTTIVVPAVPMALELPANPPAPPLNQVLETRGPVRVTIASDGGRIEIEPCRGRFVNVTVLDSRHRQLALRHSAGRVDEPDASRRGSAAEWQRGVVDVAFDGGAALVDGVAHVLVPADTELVLSTRRGDVVIRGLGGPITVDTVSGNVHVDSAPRAAPSVKLTSDTGAIHWQGRCVGRCRVQARSRSGDITLRSADPSAFTRRAADASSDTGRVYLEELPCSDPRCSSPPLPWRSLAAPHR